MTGCGTRSRRAPGGTSTDATSPEEFFAGSACGLPLPRRLPSGRFTEVVHPAPTVRMHHLEIRSPDDVDDEVAAWLLEAAGVADV